MMQDNWWELTGDDMSAEIFRFVGRTNDSSLCSFRINNDIKHLRLYNNSPVGSLHYYTFNGASSALNQDRLTFNVIKSIVDTMVNRLASQKVRTYFLPSGGDFGSHSIAKNLQKYVDGQFSALKIHKLGRDVMLDAAIFGTGFLRIRTTMNGRIELERVRQPDILIDEVEAINGDPRQLHHRRFIHRGVLAKLFPKSAAMIDQAMQSDVYSASGYSDMLEVYESFHLPSGPDAKDGRYAISIVEGLLFSAEYKKKDFPFVKISMGSKSIGWFGTGIPEQIRSLQREINITLNVIRLCVKLSVPRVLVPNNAKVPASMIDDTIGAIIKHAPGYPPQFSNTSWVSADMTNHVEMLVRKCYEITGVPQYSSFGETPNARIDSASAIQTQTAASTERFGALQRDFEQFFVDIAAQLVDLGKDLYSKEIPEDVPGREFLEQVPWDKVDIEDQFTIATFPTALLPSEPAGKIEQIEKLGQLGLPQKEIMQLLELPDINSAIAMETADLEYIEDLISKWKDGGEYESPDKYENLQQSMKRCLQVYLFYKNKNPPDGFLANLTQYIDECSQLLKTAQMESQQGVPQVVPQGAPPGEGQGQ